VCKVHELKGNILCYLWCESDDKIVVILNERVMSGQRCSHNPFTRNMREMPRIINLY